MHRDNLPLLNSKINRKLRRGKKEFERSSSISLYWERSKRWMYFRLSYRYCSMWETCWIHFLFYPLLIGCRSSRKVDSSHRSHIGLEGIMQAVVPGVPGFDRTPEAPEPPEYLLLVTAPHRVSPLSHFVALKLFLLLVFVLFQFC
jgi:hypothetical protein